MDEKKTVQTIVSVIEVDQTEEEIELTVVSKVRMKKIVQTPQLPNELERNVEVAAQQYMKGLFKFLIEHADDELVIEKEMVEELKRYDKKPYTFRTKFGSVAVKRNRVIYDNGRTEVVSAHRWKSPKNIFITRGLRSAVCDSAIKSSISNTEKEISKWPGEKDLLSRRTILNILHSEGAALIEAQERRARKVYELIQEAKCFQIETTKPWRKRLRPLTEELWESDFEGTFGSRLIWHLEGGKLTENLPQKNEKEGLITIQCDECIVPSQSKERKNVWVYTGIVNADGKAFYFIAESCAKLFFQIGALLGVLRVHEGYRDILVLGDAARWIRRWYKELPISRKAMTLCWFHLNQTVHDLLTAGFGYKVGLSVEGKCLPYLWRGEVMAAIEVIESNAKKAINRPKYRRLIRYLKARLPYIPNYKEKREQGQWVANTRIEAFNNWAVASRCKGQARTWGNTGVRAIAALVAAERNGEMEYWRQYGDLPRWDDSAQSCYQLSEGIEQIEYQVLD
jgi:hypothetical protein